MYKLADLIKENFEKIGKEQVLFVSLWKQWEQVMGEPLAAYIFPLGRKGKVLMVGAKDSLFLQEAHFLSLEILNKVNNFLGQQAFDKVQVKLLRNETPLNRITVPAPKSYQITKPRGELGKVGEKLKKYPPLYSCYLAYVKYFQEIEAQKEEEK